jgi:hypothetical protein
VQRRDVLEHARLWESRNILTRTSDLPLMVEAIAAYPSEQACATDLALLVTSCSSAPSLGVAAALVLREGMSQEWAPDASFGQDTVAAAQ